MISACTWTSKSSLRDMSSNYSKLEKIYQLAKKKTVEKWHSCCLKPPKLCIVRSKVTHFLLPQTRFLEAQNRKLAKELKDLQDRWGIETKRIKQMYETEMTQLRKLLDESDRAKAELQVQVSSLEDREVELEAT